MSPELNCFLRRFWSLHLITYLWILVTKRLDCRFQRLVFSMPKIKNLNCFRFLWFRIKKRSKKLRLFIYLTKCKIAQDDEFLVESTVRINDFKKSLTRKSSMFMDEAYGLGMTVISLYDLFSPTLNYIDENLSCKINIEVKNI